MRHARQALIVTTLLPIVLVCGTPAHGLSQADFPPPGFPPPPPDYSIETDCQDHSGYNAGAEGYVTSVFCIEKYAGGGVEPMVFAAAAAGPLPPYEPPRGQVEITQSVQLTWRFQARALSSAPPESLNQPIPYRFKYRIDGELVGVGTFSNVTSMVLGNPGGVYNAGGKSLQMEGDVEGSAPPGATLTAVVSAGFSIFGRVTMATANIAVDPYIYIDPSWHYASHFAVFAEPGPNDGGVWKRVTRDWMYGDDDQDGLTNREEAVQGTDPRKADTDGDGVDDVNDTFPLSRSETRDSDATEILITNQSAEKPRISGNRVVWADNRDGNFDIYMYDLSTRTETRITTSAADQRAPAISGDRIVWVDWRNGNADIYMYDLSTRQEKRITTDASDQSEPAISGDRIVWTDARNGDPDIYLYDLSTGHEKRLTSAAAAQSQPDISSGRIVWTDWGTGVPQVYLYDVSAETARPIAVGWSPKISARRIVYVDNRDRDLATCPCFTPAVIAPLTGTGLGCVRGTDGQITCWAGPEPDPKEACQPKLIASCTFADFAAYASYPVCESLLTATVAAPDIIGESGCIFDKECPDLGLRCVNAPTAAEIAACLAILEPYVDVDCTTRGSRSNLYMYDLSTGVEIPISTPGLSQEAPDISGDRIVWVDWRTGDSQIRMYDRSTDSETTLTTNASRKGFPAIFGQRVVWEDDRNGTRNIYAVAGDGIGDAVDTLQDVSSQDFSDVGLGGTTTGTVTDRGGQSLQITEEPSPKGVRIAALGDRSALPAIVTVCDGASQIALRGGDTVIVTCGSVTVEVVSGVVDIVFFGTDGSEATMSLAQGNTVTFDPGLLTVTAPPTNANTAAILVAGQAYSIPPGETVALGCASAPPTACTTGQPGVCAAGTTACTNGALVCSQNLQPSSEVCDGLDNDCNGEVDEGMDQPTECGVGACGSTGIVACVGGVLQPDTCVPGTPSAESCDGLDNDCDGSVDEDGDTLCDDANPCTTDTCGGSAGCVNTNNSLPCSDGNACTQTDTCQSGSCVGTNFSWSGVLQPINADGTSIFQLGRTVPVKFQLTGACAPITSLPATIWLAKVSSGIVGTYAETTSTAAADSGNTFRYDPTANQYIFNLGTTSLSAGTWELGIDLADGVGTRSVALVSLRSR